MNGQDQHCTVPVTDFLHRLIAWKREHRSFTAIEAEGLDPNRVEFAAWLVQRGRLTEGES